MKNDQIQVKNMADLRNTRDHRMEKVGKIAHSRKVMIIMTTMMSMWMWMYVLVALTNGVLNGLVIDLKKVDQIVVVMAVKKADPVVANDLDQVVKIIAVKKEKMVVANHLDHHVQKEMDLVPMMTVLHDLHDQNETTHDPMVTTIVLVRMVNDLKVMVTGVVDLVVNMNVKEKTIKTAMIEVMNGLILIITISMWTSTYKWTVAVIVLNEEVLVDVVHKSKVSMAGDHPSLKELENQWNLKEKADQNLQDPLVNHHQNKQNDWK
jgi:CRISPR/Cas system-associated protein Csx1